MIDRQIIRRMTTLIPQLGRKRFGFRHEKPPDPRGFPRTLPFEPCGDHRRAPAGDRCPLAQARPAGCRDRGAAGSTRADVSTRSRRLGAHPSYGRLSQPGRVSPGEAPWRGGIPGPCLNSRLVSANVSSMARRRRSARVNLSGIANPAPALSPLPSGLLRSAPPAVRFKAKSQASGDRRSRQGPAAFGAGPSSVAPLVRNRTSLAWRSPGLEAASSRRRWATAREGRAGRGRTEPDGETQKRTSP
ncbi:hypothetical protein M2202_009847 [Bradyrhizobium japonicum]|nr:hypothetical protein [Bradyrhizobium japonicum]MCP1794374.1 hypothetical protein [Bradyrhizobium japonicum]MCP1811357.1 hypothetical protein [Bradyrhizobium japonicum]MCP1821277.1 hypothetical protein [Bradyrhizobium japonicum]MCP1876312.1 hypothetical protein [Bradyrhizobium japonicum]